MAKITTYTSMKDWLDQDATNPVKPDGVTGRKWPLPRPYKARCGILEADVLKETKAVLDGSKVFYKRIQVQGAMVHTGSDTAVLMGSTMMGMSDLIGILHGRFLAIEVKAPGGQVDGIQIQFLWDVIKAGGKGCILVDPTKLNDWLVSITWNLKLEGIDVV